MTTISIEACVAIGLSSGCQAYAVWLAYHWVVPTIREFLEYPVNSLLARAGELGLDEMMLRKRLALIEFVALTLILYASWQGMGLPLAITILAIGFHLRGLVLEWMLEKREQLLRAQILVFTNKLDNLFGSSVSLATAILNLAKREETPAPLGPFIQGVARDVYLNRPIQDSLRELGRRLKLDALSLLVSVLCRTAQHGTPTKTSLAGVRDTLEYRQHIEQQMQAKTASARSQMMWLALFPFPFLTLLGLAMPKGVGLLFTDPDGKIVLVGIVCLVYLGAVIGRRLLNIK